MAEKRPEIGDVIVKMGEPTKCVVVNYLKFFDGLVVRAIIDEYTLRKQDRYIFKAEIPEWIKIGEWDFKRKCEEIEDDV